MAGADEAAGADAGTSAIRQINDEVKDLFHGRLCRLQDITNAGIGQVQTIGLDVAAGVAVIEVGQL